jgi:hypothetical protein
MNGIKIINTPECERYELHYEGKGEVFEDKSEANKVLMLHIAKDAGRELNPEEEATLITSEAD